MTTCVKLQILKHFLKIEIKLSWIFQLHVLWFDSHTWTPHVWEWSRLSLSYPQVRKLKGPKLVDWQWRDCCSSEDRENCQLNVLHKIMCIPFESMVCFSGRGSIQSSFSLVLTTPLSKHTHTVLVSGFVHTGAGGSGCIALRTVHFIPLCCGRSGQCEGPTNWRHTNSCVGVNRTRSCIAAV